jgi:hypothetical protein
VNNLDDRIKYKWSGRLQCELTGSFTVAEVQEYLTNWKAHAEKIGVNPDNYERFFDWFQDDFLDWSGPAWEVSLTADLFDVDCDVNPITEDMLKAYLGGDIIMIHKDQGKLDFGDLSVRNG